MFNLLAQPQSDQDQVLQINFKPMPMLLLVYMLVWFCRFASNILLMSLWWVDDNVDMYACRLDLDSSFKQSSHWSRGKWMMSGGGSVFWVHINDMYLPIFWSLSTTSQLKSTIHRYILLSMPIKILNLKYIFRYHVLCVVCTGSVYPHWIVFM